MLASGEDEAIRAASALHNGAFISPPGLVENIELDPGGPYHDRPGVTWQHAPEAGPESAQA